MSSVPLWMRKKQKVQIERLYRMDYGLKESLSRLESIDKRDSYKVYAVIVEVLLWVISIHDWHLDFHKQDYEERMKVKKKLSGRMKGLRYAYNVLRHEIDFIEIHEPEGNFVDFRFPDLEEGITLLSTYIVWANIEDTIPGNINPDQRESYIHYLQGKDIHKTIQKSAAFLLEENEIVFTCFG